MGSPSLSLSEARDMLAASARNLIAGTDRLTEADRAIGDGDHGVSMARGAAAVLEKIEGREFASIGELFRTAGTAILTSAGGAAGAVFGTFFRGAAERAGNRQALTAALLADMLADGWSAVERRGKAKPGDKTMIDALAPAAAEAERLKTAPLGEALPAIAAAARLGMEATRNMVAKAGKAMALGERSLGFPDPGAVSLVLILEAMAAFAVSFGNRAGPEPGPGVF